MHPEYPLSFRGMGQAQAPGILSSTLSQVGSGVLASAAVTGPAAPFVAAAGGALELAGAVARLFQGCGPTCTETTTIVNQVEPYLQANNQQYFTNPNRTTADQANALAQASAIFQTVQSNCGNPALGAAGQKCISDRFGTTCAYGLTTANEYPPYASVPYPEGVCWTWPLAYYDPIAQDIPPGGSGPATSTAAVVPVGSTAGVSLPAVLTNSDGSPNWLLILGGLALAYFLVESL
jgi:hypothetical protein